MIHELLGGAVDVSWDLRVLADEIKRDMDQMKEEDGVLEAYSTFTRFLFIVFAVGVWKALETRTGELLFAVAVAVAFGRVIR